MFHLHINSTDNIVLQVMVRLERNILNFHGSLLGFKKRQNIYLKILKKYGKTKTYYSVIFYFQQG